MQVTQKRNTFHKTFLNSQSIFFISQGDISSFVAQAMSTYTTIAKQQNCLGTSLELEGNKHTPAPEEKQQH